MEVSTGQREDLHQSRFVRGCNPEALVLGRRQQQEFWNEIVGLANPAVPITPLRAIDIVGWYMGARTGRASRGGYDAPRVRLFAADAQVFLRTLAKQHLDSGCRALNRSEQADGAPAASSDPFPNSPRGRELCLRSVSIVSSCTPDSKNVSQSSTRPPSGPTGPRGLD